MSISLTQFYLTPWVAESIVQRAKFRYFAARLSADILKRNYSKQDLCLESKNKLWGDGKHIELHNASTDISDITSLGYYLNKGVVEFIPETSTIFDPDRSDVIVIDIDPKGDFTWEDIGCSYLFMLSD
jgi:hypothetical protein